MRTNREMALRAEREKGCEYCTIDSSSRRVLGHDGASDGISIIYGDGVAGIDADSWETIIYFCPMCGKRLEVEHELSDM